MVDRAEAPLQLAMGHAFGMVAAKLQRPDAKPEELQEFGQAVGQSLQHMADPARRRRSEPGPDLLSGMANDTTDGVPMPDRDIASTGLLLLGAGHERRR